MKAVVTGAAGFLGGHLMASLAARGIAARGFDLEERPGEDWIAGSVLDPDRVAAAVAGTDLVIHAAAISDLWAPGRFTYDRVNVLGTCLVLAAARRAGAAVVLVSSYTTLIAQDTPDIVLDETVEVVPNRLMGAYPRSKRQAELAALAAAAAGQRVVIVQPGAPVGTGDHRPTPPGRLIRDLIAGKLPALLECRLNMVDARAVADATVAAGFEGQSGKRYLLTGDDIAIGDFADLVAAASGTAAPRRRVPYTLARTASGVEAVIARLTGRPPSAPVTGVRLAGRPCRFDNALARAELGFAPRPIAACVEEALAWHKAQDV